MKKNQKDLAEQLKTDGINFKGYGLIFKYVMQDITLSPEAKAIYAYLCSFAGNKNSAFPGRNKILSDLKLSKNGYYTHYNKLIRQGYIEIVKSGGIFSRNTYVLVSSPVKLRIDGNTDAEHLKDCGYGFIPKAVMLDTRLDIKAKALYAYFASYGGNINMAHPYQSTILHHLQISEKTYYTYYNQLLECNYITAEQQRVDNRYDVNYYWLNEKPNADTTKAQAKPEKVQKSVNEDDGVNTKRERRKTEDGKFGDGNGKDSKKEDITNITKRNKNNTNTNSKSSSARKFPKHTAASVKAIDDEIKKIRETLNYDVAVLSLSEAQIVEVDQSIAFMAEMLAGDHDIFDMGKSFFRKNDFRENLSFFNCNDLVQIWDRIHRLIDKPITNIKNYILTATNNQAIKNKLDSHSQYSYASYGTYQAQPQRESSFNIYDFFRKSVDRAMSDDDSPELNAV